MRLIIAPATSKMQEKADDIKREREKGEESEEVQISMLPTSTCMLGSLLVFCLAEGVCRSCLKSLLEYVLVSPVAAGDRMRAVGGETVTRLRIS